MAGITTENHQNHKQDFKNAVWFTTLVSYLSLVLDKPIVHDNKHAEIVLIVLIGK